MVDALELMDAISALVSRAAPELRVIHIDLAPADAARPCLVLELLKEETADASAALVYKKCGFLLTLLDQVGDYASSGTREMLELRGRVLAPFAGGRLEVGDRWLPVKAQCTGRELDRAFIELWLEWYDNRPGRPTQLPVAEAVVTRVALEGGGG